jgi:hypothetical protein
MIINILKNNNNKPIGWEMEGETPEEIRKVTTIRNLQFFGLGQTNIEYNGRRNSDDKNYNPGILSWIQKEHQK